MSRRPAVALAVLLVLTAPGARAEDPCRAGAASLDDRRALDSLREAIATACGCAAEGGRGRRDFVRCARAALRRALADGALRAACVDTAQRDIRGMTCGTNRVACGQVDVDGAPSCRLSAPGGRHGCGMHPRRTEVACGASAGCLDVTEWTAGTCLDPRRRGPHGVGARVVPMVKDSVTAPGTERRLDTVVWYPSPSLEPLDNRYGAVVDAPLDASGGPYPAVMFSHGSCGYPEQSVFLTALLASYGYVVVAPPHPGNTIAELPACGTLAAQVDAAFQRPRDIVFALDAMLAASDDPTSPFFASMDAERIGMMGHSFGGLTTFTTLTIEDRFKVAVPLAPAILGAPVLRIPSLIMLGQIDSRVDNAAIRTAHANALPPKILVEVENAGHYAFSDFCFQSADCNPPLTATQDEAHDQVLRWVVPFLERYLAGSGAAEPFFNAAPPGALVAQAR